MLYYIKRIISFIKTDIILLKSINIKYLIIYILGFIFLTILGLLLSNTKYYNKIFDIKTIINMCFEIYNIIFLTLFFIKLKTQKFFTHLLTNRGFYIAEFEIFLFSISLLIIFIALTIPFVFFISPYDFVYKVLMYLSIIIESILVAHWKIWKYVLFTIIYYIIIVLLMTISLCLLPNYIDPEHNQVIETTLYATQIIVLICIELKIIKNLITKETN